MFRALGRVRILALFFRGTVVVTLGLAYLLVPPVSGIGARFDSPQHAISEAFGPTGWFGPVNRFTLYDRASTAEGHVFVYAGFHPNNQDVASLPSMFGITDAKPSWRGWYAHGMMAVQQPPSLSDANVLSCTTAQRPVSGQDFLVLAGYVRYPDVARVEITFASGYTRHALVHNAAFAVLTADERVVTQLRAVNQHGHVLQTIEGTTCT